MTPIMMTVTDSTVFFFPGPALAHIRITPLTCLNCAQGNEGPILIALLIDLQGELECRTYGAFAHTRHSIA